MIPGEDMVQEYRRRSRVCPLDRMKSNEVKEYFLDGYEKIIMWSGEGSKGL